MQNKDTHFDKPFFAEAHTHSGSWVGLLCKMRGPILTTFLYLTHKTHFLKTYPCLLFLVFSNIFCWTENLSSLLLLLPVLAWKQITGSAVLMLVMQLMMVVMMMTCPHTAQRPKHFLSSMVNLLALAPVTLQLISISDWPCSGASSLIMWPALWDPTGSSSICEKNLEGNKA